jgi:hypothetical protein
MKSSREKMPDSYSPEETARRREAALKKMLATPPSPFTPKAKKKPSPAKRKAKR